MEHSPNSHPGRGDNRWPEWYEAGLRELLTDCDAFVTVLDQGWEPCHWTQFEVRLAVQDGVVPRFCHWNPEGIEVARMTDHLGRKLPNDLDELADSLAT